MNRKARFLVAMIMAALAFPGTAHAQPAFEQPQTLDDLFAAVAQKVPEFGGMFISNNGKTLRVYLTDVGPGKAAAVEAAVEMAIVDVFDASVIPEDGIEIIPEDRTKARRARYGFLQLRGWYTEMVGPILSIPGITFTDIDEAKNRLGIGVEADVVKRQVVKRLGKLGIPREAVVIEVTEPIEPVHTVPTPFPPLHTVQSPFSPRQGGYITRRLLCNQTGIGITGGTLGFNAVRLSTSGNVRGFVTNSHNTAAWWNLDTNVGFPPAQFYQAPGFYPSELVGKETIDYQGFQGFPCPAGRICRYSDSAFITYNTGVASAHAIIARTTGITTSISGPGLILAVSHSVSSVPDVGPGMFGISAPPSQPYLVGLKLNKVGSTTGWTQGSIEQTDVMIPVPPPSIIVGCPNDRTDPMLPPPGATLISQYVVGHPVNDVVNSGDSGSPVFRIRNPRRRHVELYGILWGRMGYKKFVFSAIGGSPYQPAGIQTDLGPLDYVGQCLPPNPGC